MAAKGVKLSEQAKQNIRNGQPRGENHPNWKGEKVEYRGLHDWVVLWKGKASLCEVCGSTDRKRYEWANKDHKYRRVLDDYISMCVPCHRLYDYENNKYAIRGKTKYD